MGIPSQAEYERDEQTRFYNEMRRKERDWSKAPRHDRKQEEDEWLDALANRPDVVAERVSWLLDGNYGFGSYKNAHEVIRRPRMNHEAWLVQVVGTLEWGVPGDVTRKTWHKLTPSQQSRLNKMLAPIIREAKAQERP